MKKGIPASKGYAIGKVFIRESNDINIVERTIEDLGEEEYRLKTAISTSKEQLKKIKENAEKELGHEKVAVFESHIMFLEDHEFTGAAIMNISNNKVNAEKALSDVVDMYMDMYMDIFQSVEDEYMRERAADVKDVGRRILGNLLGNIDESQENLDKNTIIVSYLYNPKHPTILKLIKMTIDAAHKEGKWCGMCGEVAGDEEMIPILVEYALDEFSMSATSILKAKQIIMNN